MRTANARTGITGLQIDVAGIDPGCVRPDDSWRETQKGMTDVDWQEGARTLGALLSTTRFDRLARWLLEQGYTLRDSCWVSSRGVKAVSIKGRVYHEARGVIRSITL